MRYALFSTHRSHFLRRGSTYGVGQRQEEEHHRNASQGATGRRSGEAAAQIGEDGSKENAGANDDAIGRQVAVQTKGER